MMTPIIPQDIPYKLSRVSLEYAENPIGLIPDASERLWAVLSEEDRDDFMYGRVRHWQFDQYWHRIPYDIMQKAFTQEELYYLWAGSAVCNCVSDHIEKHEPLLWKVENCLYQYGSGRAEGQSLCDSRNYNKIAASLDGLRRLQLNLPDFEVRLTHSRSINTSGSAEHLEQYLWLDAPFGLLVYYKSVHVLTVGFAFAEEGILIAQIQLRNKKGNRFLYKLSQVGDYAPRHYVDVVLDIFHNAFADQDLFLIEGGSAVDAVRRSYGNQVCSMTHDDAVRIAALYNRELASFKRDGNTELLRQGRNYHKLLRGADGIVHHSE